MLKAVLFDVDGVLVNSEELYHRIVNRTYEKYSMHFDKEEYIQRYMLDPRGTKGVVADFGMTRKFGVTDVEIEAEKHEIMKQVLGKELQPIPGYEIVFEMDMYLRAAVSSAPWPEVEVKLSKFDLIKEFDRITTATDVRKRKPDKECYVITCHALGIRPEEAAVIEDTPSGIAAGKDAGCIVVGFPNGYTAGMDMSRADRTIKSLSEINSVFLESLF